MQTYEYTPPIAEHIIREALERAGQPYDTLETDPAYVSINRFIRQEYIQFLFSARLPWNVRFNQVYSDTELVKIDATTTDTLITVPLGVIKLEMQEWSSLTVEKAEKDGSTETVNVIFDNISDAYVKTPIKIWRIAHTLNVENMPRIVIEATIARSVVNYLMLFEQDNTMIQVAVETRQEADARLNREIINSTNVNLKKVANG